jgi:beta-galactosidase/beta-glucuronidase
MGHRYPRPQLTRDGWTSLDGEWDFAFDPPARWQTPGEVRWDRRILVPFAPETVASGIGDTGFFEAAWYRRSLSQVQKNGKRVILHFGAVDWDASVWVDGLLVAHHQGGYTPFSCDITELVALPGDHELVVRALDDPHDLARPRGKQDWQLEPHSIWYPRTSGIWQTVWMEEVPPTRIGGLQWTPNLERWELGLVASLAGRFTPGLRLSVRITCVGKLLADDTYLLTHPEVSRRIALSDPGIDDSRNELLWSPATPTLMEAEMRLLAPDGTVLDRVGSYTALRSIHVQGDRILLNGRPYPLRLVLDQGYWPDTGMTPPDDDALRRDVELAKAMGFNGVRKHQKIECPRYLWWADRLGLLVWEEMPSAYRFTSASVERLTREWLEVLARDSSHPCIVAWVPFNESWGVPNLPANPAERHYIQALYHLTHTLDPTRPVVGNDGWESVATDIIGVHDYDTDPERIARRYMAPEVRPHLYRRERFGGRQLVIEGHPHGDHPIILSEFGGVTLGVGGGTWGYSRVRTPEDLADVLASLFTVVRRLDFFAGYCYTQFADTWQEANGLLTADRRPKVPLEQLRAMNGSPILPPGPPCDVAEVDSIPTPSAPPPKAPEDKS